MFTRFDTIGSILRNTLAFGFVAILSLSSFLQDLRVLADLPWTALAGMLAVVAGVLAAFVALVLMSGQNGAGRRKDIAAQDHEAETEFDADRIIAAHLARRACLAPPRREFGRKAR